MNIFELNFYQDENRRKHKLVPIQFYRKFWYKGIELLIYKNHYVLSKKLHVLLGKHDSKFACTRCLSSFSSQSVLPKHKQRCDHQDITSIRTSNQSHLPWQKIFYKKPKIN